MLWRCSKTRACLTADANRAQNWLARIAMLKMPWVGLLLATRGARFALCDMANGATPTYVQRNHTRFICGCITIMGVICAVVGGALIYKGYHADLLISGVIAAISGMTGLLGQSKPTPPPQDVTMTAGPPSEVKLEQPKPPIPKPTS